VELNYQPSEQTWYFRQRDVFRVLRRIFAVALKKHLVTSNPCSTVEFPIRVKGCSGHTGFGTVGGLLEGQGS
jgi:hypothetical protein